MLNIEQILVSCQNTLRWCTQGVPGQKVWASLSASTAILRCNGRVHSLYLCRYINYALSISIILSIGFLTTACQREEGEASSDNTSKTNAAPASMREKNVKNENDNQLVLIPAGEFILGSNKKDTKDQQKEYGLVNALYVDENPQQTFVLPAFYINKLEVTNREYKAFVVATKRKEPFYWTQNGYNLVEARLLETDLETLRWIATEYFKFDLDTSTMSKRELIDAMKNDWQVKDTLPVTGVTWFDAHDYCQWRNLRLPSEYEWERAARGTEGLEYPWGNEWQPDITNTGDNTDWPDGIMPVGSFPENQSPDGVLDMAGNVWEWVDSWYLPYPGSILERKDFGEKNKVLRGGGGGTGHYALSIFFRSAARSFAPPMTSSDDIGFRCAKSASNMP